LASLDVLVEEEAHPEQAVDAIPERRHVYINTSIDDPTQPIPATSWQNFASGFKKRRG
jgi:hypothetical protein